MDNTILLTATHLGPYELDRVHLGDCIELLRGLESCCIDSCVTDPPYELGFMGKHWDATGIAYCVELWREVYRVLKPGAHLLAFGGTRTYHRMACAIEDAGFEIRDQMQWLYGSGFPKSHDISKAIDKADGIWRGKSNGVVSQNGAMSGPNYQRTPKEPPATPAAIKWQGWGTALKPANEPICVARKPFNCTVAENVLQWGTGAINVDAGRIGTEQTVTTIKDFSEVHGNKFGISGAKYPKVGEKINPPGRWPANVLLDEEAAKMLDEQVGEAIHGAGKKKEHGGCFVDNKSGTSFHSFGAGKFSPRFGDSGGPSRFFYVAKASKSEREAGLEGFEGKLKIVYSYSDKPNDPANGMFKDRDTTRANHHPTVKPIKLMEYLVKLVTPPNGIVLDPFSGSGTTGCACIGFRFIGFEKEEKYCEISNKRIEAAKAQGVLNLG